MSARPRRAGGVARMQQAVLGRSRFVPVAAPPADSTLFGGAAALLAYCPDCKCENAIEVEALDAGRPDRPRCRCGTAFSAFRAAPEESTGEGRHG